MNKNNNFQKKVKENTQKGYQNTKEAVQEGKEKVDEFCHSSA